MYSLYKNSLANINLLKTKFPTFVQLGGYLGSLLGPLLKIGLLLLGNVFKTLAKSLILPLTLTTAVWATDEAIYKKMFASAMTTLVFSNKYLNDIMKMVESLEESNLLINQ